MSELAIGILGCVALLALFLTGIELFAGMAIIGVIGYAIVVSPTAAFSMLSNDFADALESYSFTVIPLFVFMGQIAFNAGIARRLYDTCHRFLGHVPGGLAMATVAGATVFKAICGSQIATVVTFASVAVPEMDRFNYKKRLSTGIVATVSTLGILIPPSITLIGIGIITQQSIGRLFLAGVIPGLMLSLGYILVILGWARMNRQLGPATEKFSWRQRMETVPAVMWPVLIFLVVVGGMVKGFFTPTEAGSVGAFAVLLLCLGKREIGFSGIRISLHEALRTTVMVLMLIAASNVLGRFIGVTNIPAVAAQWVVGLPIHRHVVMLVVFLIYLVGGSIIDDMAFVILATPIFFPAITQMGYDPVWACILLAVTVCVGSVIPPIAMPVFVTQKVTKVPISVIYSGVYPFLIAMMICILLLFIFPQLVTYLPSVLMN